MHTTEYALIKCLSTTYSDTHVDFFNDCRSLRAVALLVKAPHRLEVKIALQPFFQFCGEGSRPCSQNKEFVSPVPSCWLGQQQALNPKIRTSGSSILLLQPNARKPKHFVSWNFTCLWYPGISPFLLYPSYKQQVTGTEPFLEGSPRVSWSGLHYERLPCFGS